MKKLTVALSQEPPNSLAKTFKQIYEIIAGSHHAVPIQEPNVKENTKGRPSLKSIAKDQKKSTKRNPSAFEIAESQLKKESAAKKRPLKTQKRKSK